MVSTVAKIRAYLRSVWLFTWYMCDVSCVSPGASSVQVNEHPAPPAATAAPRPAAIGTRAPRVINKSIRKGSAPRNFRSGRVCSGFEPGASSLQRQAEWEERYDRTWSQFCMLCTALAVVVVAVAWAGLQVSHAPRDH